MQTVAHGVFRNGKVEFPKLPEGVPDETHAVVTFVAQNATEMERLGITREQAAEYRFGLGAGIKDWDSPEMDIYNDYHRYKAELDKQRES